MKGGYESLGEAEAQEPLGEDSLLRSDSEQQESASPPASPWAHRARLAALCLAVVSCVALGSYALASNMHGKQLPAGLQSHGAKKAGAGFVFCNENEVLLLLRSSKHNDSTWGLPGGNVEPGDADFQTTAEREAAEEMGPLPDYTITSTLLTKRGKKDQKHFTVFVAALSAESKNQFQPQLNHEHREARWFSWDDIVGEAPPPLHPVVQKLISDLDLRKRLAAALPKWGDLEAEHAAVTMHAGDDDNDDLEDDDDDDDDHHGVERKHGHGHHKHHPVKVRGSGLLLVHGHEGIFLLRNSSHNNKTWDLPGGNVDLEDQHLEAAARREAVEELGACPEFINAGSPIHTRRGKHDEKHFTVFVGSVTDDVRTNFAPKLSDESLDCQWLDIHKLAQAPDVHPHIEKLFQGEARKQLEEILKFKV